MSFARLRLLLAAVLFLGWLAWLGLAVSRKGTVQIVSRAQLAAATHWVVLDLKVGGDGVPLEKVTIKDVIVGDKISGEIEVKNLPSSVTPLPVAGESRTPLAGEYFVPLVKGADGRFHIAGLPRSPGLDAHTPEHCLLYPWTDDVKKQVQSLK